MVIYNFFLGETFTFSFWQEKSKSFFLTLTTHRHIMSYLIIYEKIQ